MTDDVYQALAILRDRGVAGPVRTAIVLGTGLSGIADSLDDAVAVPYADLPGFPQGSVTGHRGQLVVGRWDGVPVAVMQGRAHFYEQGDARAMLTPIQTLAGLGAQVLLLTNAAGTLNLDWYPGSLAIISDHINLTGINPLVGLPGDERFVPLADAYDKALRARLRRAAAGSGVANLREGVYMFYPGPSFETAAEIKIAKQFGADLVGMSTVPEVIIARFLGLRVAAVSVVTNFATGLSGGNPSHTETKGAALGASVSMRRLLRAFVKIHDAAPT